MALADSSRVYEKPKEAHRRVLCFNGGPESSWDYTATSAGYEIWREHIERRANESKQRFGTFNITL